MTMTTKKTARPILLAIVGAHLLVGGSAVFANEPAGPLHQLATFRQTTPSKGAVAKTLFYKNEDVIKTTSVTTKTAVYGDVVTPVYTTVKTPIYDSKGKITGYTSIKVQTGTTTVNKIVGYTSTVTKSTNITPKASVLTTSSATGTTLGSAPVQVTFDIPPPAQFAAYLDGTQDALFRFSASATGIPVLDGGIYSQSFGPGTLSLTRKKPIIGLGNVQLSNLLTATFDSLQFYAPQGGSNFWLTGRTGTNSIAFTSDFYRLTIPGQDIDNAFTIAGSGASPISLASIDAALTNVTGSRSLGSFRGNATGAFQTSGVPEASTWAMLILGVGFTGSTMRRRRAPKAEGARGTALSVI